MTSPNFAYGTPEKNTHKLLVTSFAYRFCLKVYFTMRHLCQLSATWSLRGSGHTLREAVQVLYPA